MSDIPFKPGFLGRLAPRLPSAPKLNAASNAGPRRLAMLALGGAGVVGLIAVVTLTGQREPVVSRDARMKAVDPLPGGLYTTPEQDALARKANDAAAAVAMQRGQSYTPPIAPSQLVRAAPLEVQEAVPLPITPREPMATATPAPQPVQFSVPEPLRIAAAAPKAQPARFVVQADDPPRVTQVAAPAAQQGDGQAQAAAQQAYNAAIRDLFLQWGGRLPRTDVILPPRAEEGDRDDAGSSGSASPAAFRPAPARLRDALGAAPAPAGAASEGRILIPAGRGIYAHPVLAVSSDASAPVVFQADTGPLAGDRMIGTFARQEDRLVIHINQVIHNGEPIGVDGLVIAPGSMETSVASNVDQHYVSRFLLPAAAAFVAGLGQATAQTSNSAAVLSPFGGVTTTSRLNIQQQAGIAAGAAAAQVGSTLNEARPKGPTVSLEPNVAVGVMFLTNVTSRLAQ